MSQADTITCRAPGKIVLWGEYAVLAGAPAAVMAVNRYATATLKLHTTPNWRFSSKGFLSAAVDTPNPALCRAPVAQMATAALNQWGYTAYPIPFSLVTDSTPFFHQHADHQQADHQQAERAGNTKLGIGSSAAVCVATYMSLAQSLGRDAKLAEAMAVHSAFQGGSGSGLDVAASWRGGLLRFQRQADGLDLQTVTWPAHLHWAVLWSGSSSHTPSHLASFSQWRKQAPQAPLERLCAASETLFSAFTLDNFARYQQCLQQLDAAAKLNIFTPQHSELATIANRLGLVYKPCGAGGGDIGIALTDNPAALTEFCQAAAHHNLPTLDLEIAQHGVEISD